MWGGEARWGSPGRVGACSQWGPGEPAPVQAIPPPPPRPLLVSPPLLRGWGRPLPGPRGLRGSAREALRATKRYQEGKLSFIGGLSRKGVREAGLGRGTLEVATG